MFWRDLFSAATAILAVAVPGQLSAAAAVDEASAGRFFEQRIRPVLVENCYECHSARSKLLKGGLHLDTRAGLLAGGDSGAVVTPGDPERSRLIQAVRYGDRDLQMPPKHALHDTVVADLVAWVAQGAWFPPEAPTTTATASALKTASTHHWAFQPLLKSQPPTDIGPGTESTRHPIDRFIQARLTTAGLRPAAPADRRTLLRRAYFDLTGLPPTPQAVEAFVADPDPDAFARRIDELMASPHYGERWGRWWLDVARYADTNGQDENKVMSNAWRYRDWVIRSFNRDLPFSQFITEQLAGDLLPTEGVPESTLFDRWMATGFLVLGPKMLAEQDKPKLVMDIVDEQIDVVTRAFLGLTVGCARCHDHKFDPIPTRDYYALAGIFKSTHTMENLSFVSKFNERRVASQAELAAIEFNASAVTKATNQLAVALREANAALLGARRQQFEHVLTHPELTVSAAASAAKSSGSIETNLWNDVRAAIAVDPGSNVLSRVLRNLADDAEQRSAFLRELATPTSDAAARARGRLGGAFQATGSNFLELPHSMELEPAELTIETWVWTSAFPGGGDPRRWLVNKNGNEWTEGHYALVLDRSRPGAYLNIGGGRENVFSVWSEGATLRTNQWHHLACTYDGTLLRLYVDGAPAGSTKVGRSRVPGKAALALGRRQDGYIGFQGRLDETRVYQRALSADELKGHFEHPESPSTQGVVARWEFNPLSPLEQQSMEWAEVREQLLRPGGWLALPADPRKEYPTLTVENLVLLETRISQLRASAPPAAAWALAVSEGSPTNLPVHIRGSHLNLARDPVPRGFIQVVHAARGSELPSDHSGRLELARWLTAPENPLPARVIVNRVWQAHFGEGLVRSPDNFGVRGETPTHPELLDWLAREFQNNGWSLKELHRLILNSSTWQQRSTAEAATLEADPDNRLLSRFPRQRLEAEMIRDALLAVSGCLDRTIGGSLVSWKNDEYVPRTDEPYQSTRRSVYLPIVRDGVYDVFSIFDFANPSVGTAKRTPTVVSHQSLFFLNSPLVKASASALTDRLLKAPASTDSARVRLAYDWVLNRPPNPQEIALSEQFLGAARGHSGERPPRAVWSAYCQMLFAANEFVYRD